MLQIMVWTAAQDFQKGLRIDPKMKGVTNVKLSKWRKLRPNVISPSCLILQNKL